MIRAAPNRRRKAVFHAIRCLGRYRKSKRKSKPVARKPAPLHDFRP